MRLDKFLCEKNIGSRSDVKNKIKKGLVMVNNTVVTDSSIQVTTKDSIVFNRTDYSGSELAYFMLNKPEGLVSATDDIKEQTVISLFKDEPYRNLFPVGRLDKDTTGLLLITNDGQLAHELLSPKKHVNKTYHVTCEKAISKEDCKTLEKGVDIGDETVTLPATVMIETENTLLLTIHEGRYHQVKRMLKAVGNEVIKLNRKSMGNLILDESLKSGEYRKLSEEEVKSLKELNNREVIL